MKPKGTWIQMREWRRNRNSGEGTGIAMKKEPTWTKRKKKNSKKTGIGEEGGERKGEREGAIAKGPGKRRASSLHGDVTMARR